jgi:tRNA-dihydrouridine synthase A
VIDALLPYTERHLRAGGRLNNVVRHILGLYHGQPRARAFRRHLSERAPREGAGPDVLREALRLVEGSAAAAPLAAE